jgi:hypothetical protein
MNAREAERALEEAEVVPVLQTSIPGGKELLAACLDAEIPAALGGGEGCTTGGCAPKVQLYVREADLPRLQALLESRWRHLLDQEGTVPPTATEGEAEGEPPCPACGTAAPLVEGACSDCGLQLA